MKKRKINAARQNLTTPKQSIQLFPLWEAVYEKSSNWYLVFSNQQKPEHLIFGRKYNGLSETSDPLDSRRHRRHAARSPVPDLAPQSGCAASRARIRN